VNSRSPETGGRPKKEMPRFAAETSKDVVELRRKTYLCFVAPLSFSAN
jgi:hypothetical protein